ncbi:HlyD family efflux transporter periplasmic adaptor subunit [Sulfurimonas sp. HSL-1716]|uniref:HlyD family secretion protein n=1 Tax=Hydrocurvibacter sulfurireducens TaxID=3131937 RepID=UPI0031F96121
MSELQESTKNKKKKRNNILILLALFFIISGGGYTLYYYMFAQFYESTDNAYVGQNIVYVTPQTAGTVDDVLVSEMQYVKAGAVLGHIDSRNANLAFEEAKSNLAKTVRRIKQLQVQKEEAKDAISLAEVNLNKTKDDLKRNEFLIKKNAITDEKFKNLKYTYEAALQRLEIARKKLLSLNAIVKDTDLSQNPEIKNAVVRVEKSYLNMKRCNILAPISGMIAKKNFTIGENVSTASTLLSIVPTEGFWVDANFKETQLKNISVSQNVTLTSDVYGKDVVYHGTVKGIAPGTGAVFSLLPAQNASGNWIKIVQRIPVRILLNEKELKKHPLQVGNSMSVTVDVHKKNGSLLKHAILEKNSDKNYRLYPNALKESELIADEIIKQNS